MEMYKIGLSLMIFCTTFLVSCNKDDCMEKEKKNCLVTNELNPVCGCNGVTYDNPSTAECNSITDYTMGACEQVLRNFTGFLNFELSNLEII